ncbi:MAG: FmdB family zinc ribbon protein [Desulfosoma sp.]|uniref:FmdB family zinc ribbon protein n=1 Tax=Desulfosoma sp. TaxID=2603217 RepID=UPI00404B4DC0
MPIYEFRCVRCGHIQEVLTTGSQSEVALVCEQCQGEAMERVLSRVSYVMGHSSSGGRSGPRVTSKSCAPGSSCSTIELPGHTR